MPAGVGRKLTEAHDTELPHSTPPDPITFTRKSRTVNPAAASNTSYG